MQSVIESTEGRTLRYRLLVQEATPSNNVIKEMHFKAYKALRARFRYLVLQALEGQRPTAPIAFSFLVIKRHSAGSLDWDNALGGLKPLLDCLVQASKRNPSGLGLVVDDNPRSMPFAPVMEQVQAKCGEGFTEVLVYELDAPPAVSAESCAPTKGTKNLKGLSLVDSSNSQELPYRRLPHDCPDRGAP